MSVYYALNLIWPEKGAFPSGFAEIDVSEYEVHGLYHPEPQWADHQKDISGERGFGAPDGSEEDGEKKDDNGSKTEVVELVSER